MTFPAQAGLLDDGYADPPLLTDQDGAARWIRLNRPESRNALTPALIAALDSAMADAMADEHTSVVVIAGVGRSFCAGADLRYMLDLARAGKEPHEFLSATSECFSRIEGAAKPVIAAVHGHAVAGGLELALACDAVVAQTGTLIGDGHLRNGLLPGAGASVRLPRKVGEPLARWLILTGELMKAERFMASGFVHTVASPEMFDHTVSVVAASLATATDGSPARVKQLLNGWAESSSEEALVRELSIFAEHWREQDVTAMLTEFVNRKIKG